MNDKASQLSFAARPFLLIFLVSPAVATSWASRLSGLEVRMVTDEADAVLTILAKRQAKDVISEADWQRLFSAEGYVRLKKREAELKRTFTDDDFRAFVLSDELAGRAPALKETLDRWKQADITGAARRALAYLPAGVRLRAKIYPVIKPQTNSFVFEVRTDPAVFLYINPKTTRAQFENTLGHELHHIGYAATCASAKPAATQAKPPRVQAVLDWISAFGEGVAMLAAAGGPDVHPHRASEPEDRARWDRDMANFNPDLKKVEKFFEDILAGRLKEKEEIDRVAYSFFGVQGPWYTVGWKMAVRIEKSYGRARLIACLCDPLTFLKTYNQAAAEYNRTAREPLALWSDSLLDTLAHW